MLTSEKLKEISTEILEQANKIMESKAREYGPVDRMGNFSRRAVLLRANNPSKIILSDLSKHFDVIVRAVNTGDYEWCWTKKDGGEGLKQRFADMINYLFLLAGAMVEKKLDTLTTTVGTPADTDIATDIANVQGVERC